MSFNYTASQFFPPANSAPNEFQQARFTPNFGAPAGGNAPSTGFPAPPINSAFAAPNTGFAQPQSAFGDSALANSPAPHNVAPTSAFGATPSFGAPNFGAPPNFGAGLAANPGNFRANSTANFPTNFGPTSGSLGMGNANLGTNSANFSTNTATFNPGSTNFGPPTVNIATNSAHFPNTTNMGNSAFSSEPTKPKRKEKKREKEAKKELKKATESVNAKSPHNLVPLSIPHFPRVPFAPSAPKISHDLGILKPLPAPVTRCDFRSPDPWDAENQMRMKSIEQQYLSSQISLQTAYDRLTAMHKAERTEMEKRGLVDSVTNRRELSDAIQFTGSCAEMCPVYERVRRAHENDVLSLEKNARGQADQPLAIKSFTRSSAGQLAPLPSDVRPPPVLVSTLEYIVGELVPKLPQSHAFIWDRTRSIRQDFTYQNYQGAEAIWCCEVIARIHCRSLHTMAYQSRLTGLDWSQQQEIEQFDKCLQSLMEFNQVLPSPNQPEMCSYLLLLHLNRPKVLATIDYLPLAISRHPLVLLALELRQLAKTAIPEFFVRVRQSDVPATFRCVAELHFNALRMQICRDLALSVHRQRNMYPFARFQQLLGFESAEDAQEFCDFFDLQVNQSEAGIEIDLLTWSESNVRDKQSFKPAADASLNMLLGKQDLLTPLGPPVDVTPASLASPGQSFRAPAAGGGDHGFTIPKATPQAPVSLGSQSAIEPQSAANLPAQALKTDSNEHTNKQEVEKAARLAEIRKEEARLQQIQAVNEARKQRLLEQKRQVQQQRELEEQQKQMKEQQLEMEKRQRETEARQREQERQQNEQRLLNEQRQHQRETQRAEFISQVSQRILQRIVQNEAQNDVQVVLESMARSQRHRLQRVCHKIADSAHEAYKSQLTQQRRAEEMRLFRSKRQRVVSQRKARPDSYDMSFGSSGSNVALPPSRPTITATSVHGETVDGSALANILRPAFAQGLRRLVVVADSISDLGQWLATVLPVNQSLMVFPNEFCEIIYSEPTEYSRDTAVLSTRPAPVASSVVWATLTDPTVPALTTAIQHLVNEYVARQQNELASLRSLKPKRRRAVSDYYPKPVNQDHDSLLSFGSETSMRRESLADTEQRLRRAIAHAKELSSTI